MQQPRVKVPVEQCWEEWSQFVSKHLEEFGSSCLDMAEVEGADTSLMAVAHVMVYLQEPLLNVLKLAALDDEAGNPDGPWTSAYPPLRDLLEEAVAEALRQVEAEALRQVEEVERTQKDNGPTTVCFDCGGTVPISDSWRSTTRDVVLCEPCFQKAEAAGRAREQENSNG